MPKPLDEIRDVYDGPRPPVSVVILTKDERINIAAALDSCRWSDDVHVLDSGSTDGTTEIARSRGVPVWTNAFESFGRQRNWAIDHIPLRHDWVFHLDADERFTPGLVAEIAEEIARNPAHAGYYVANQMVLHGSWLRRSAGYPAYQVRLFHKGRLRFSDHGHGQREQTTGTLGTLRTPYVHHNFSKGLDDWIKRHERYSDLEAAQILADRASGATGGTGSILSGLRSADGVVRRRALKNLASRLPARALVRWLHTVFVKGAILDGRAGWTYASLLYRYESMIAAKVRAGRRMGPDARA